VKLLEEAETAPIKPHPATRRGMTIAGLKHLESKVAGIPKIEYGM
jgi:hypothetical protein